MKSTLEKLVFALVVLVSILGVYFSRTDLPFFERTYIRENGLIEWFTVVGLILGAFICFYRSRVLAPFRDKLFVFALVFQGLVFLLGVGQEISLGQRLLSRSENRILFGLILGALMGFYFLIVPLLYSKLEKFHELVDRLAIPVPKLAHIIAYAALFAAVHFIPGQRSGEILEFGGVWIFILMIYNPLNREVFSRKTFDR